MGQLLSRYGDRVKLVWRDFPIDNLHPQARKAHEAARCASAQGKFWQYHKALYTGSPKQPDQLPTVAQEAGLDLARFKACVADGKQQAAAVQKDVEEGQRLDVTGTPTFFINGRPLVGAQPLEAFARMIDDELARSGK
jgi:protein-disulfide isomerase